jgi:hypothetical protein
MSNGPTDPALSESVTHPVAAPRSALQLHAVGLERQRELLEAAMRYDEEQRATFARFLHDRVSQALVAVELGLHVLARDVDATSDVSVRTITELVQEAGREVQRAALSLRPAAVGELSFADSLRRLADDWGTLSAVPVELSITGGNTPQTVGPVIYRMLQILLGTFVQPNKSSGVSVRVSSTATRISVEFVAESLAPRCRIQLISSSPLARGSFRSVRISFGSGKLDRSSKGGQPDKYSIACSASGQTMRLSVVDESFRALRKKNT